MKTFTTFILALFLAFSAGCMNMYVRFPTTTAQIEETYQCSKETSTISIIVMFPQMMSDAGSEGFMFENIFTIPLGCLVLVDSACECVIDTLCYPADYFIAKSRAKQL